MTKRGALALVTLAHGLGSLSILAVAPLSPFLLDGLALSRVQVGFFLPAAYLGGMLFALPAGWLTERRGVRWPLVLGQTLTGAMVVLASLAPDLVAALGFLFLGGLGFSVLNPATGKAIIDWFPPRERGRAMGVKQTGLTLGGIVSAVVVIFACGLSGGGILVGPPIFGLLLHLTDSYRGPWLVLAATALAVATTLPRLQPLVQRDPVAQRAA